MLPELRVKVGFTAVNFASPKRVESNNMRKDEEGVEKGYM
jgi:hypothetical protein